ncbi:hypothetical protein BDN72DRAFT_906690, partial [Pluteus cervinus]
MFTVPKPALYQVPIATKTECFSYALRLVSIRSEMHEVVFFRKNGDRTNKVDLPYKVPPHVKADIELGEFYESTECLEFGWLKDGYGHFPFVPKGDIFKGQILGRLAYSRYTLPIENSPYGFSLAKDVMESWQRLELALSWVFSVASGTTGYPLSFNPRLPVSQGYARAHKKKNTAQNCAMNSIYAFRELVGACLLAMAQCENWDDRLLGRSKEFSPEWVAELRRELAGAEVVGAIVDINETDWWRKIYVMQQRSSLWVMAGERKMNEKWKLITRVNPVVMSSPVVDGMQDFWAKGWNHLKEHQHLIPDGRADEHWAVDGSYDESTGWTFRLHPEIESKLQVDEEPLPEPEQPLPPPTPSAISKQLPGEDWEAFFKRRAEEDEIVIAEETPEEKRSRELAEKRAVKPANTSKAAKVFEWDVVRGHWLRKLVEPKDVGKVWNEYEPTQRRYNA